MRFYAEKTTSINGMVLYHIRYGYINGLLKVQNDRFEFLPINQTEAGRDTGDLHFQGTISNYTVNETGPEMLVRAINASLHL